MTLFGEDSGMEDIQKVCDAIHKCCGNRVLVCRSHWRSGAGQSVEFVFFLYSANVAWMAFVPPLKAFCFIQTQEKAVLPQYNTCTGIA